jgi:hypothetical protein
MRICICDQDAQSPEKLHKLPQILYCVICKVSVRLPVYEGNMTNVDRRPAAATMLIQLYSSSG